MTTIDDIQNEAAFIQHLIKLSMPTGLNHTPTPWQKGPVFSVSGDPEPLSLGDDGHTISSGAGAVIARFERTEDRDLALYFANVHAGIIGFLRNQAVSFDFAADAAVDKDPALESFLRERAEITRIYADLFCRLGVPEATQEEPT